MSRSAGLHLSVNPIPLLGASVASACGKQKIISMARSSHGTALWNFPRLTKAASFYEDLLTLRSNSNRDHPHFAQARAFLANINLDR